MRPSGLYRVRGLLLERAVRSREVGGVDNRPEQPLSDVGCGMRPLERDY